MRITVSMPCFGRPKRTMRAVESICSQNINGWEALVVGDGCSDMQDLILSNSFADLQREAQANGNILSISNLAYNRGGYGYHIINENIKYANGKYFVFLSNDDVIMPNHFESMLSGIENTEYDFVYYNTFISALFEHDEKLEKIRESKLEAGLIGHAEIIVKTDFLRTMPLHTDEYGHDWKLIENMMQNGKYKKVFSEPTYIIKGVGELRRDFID